jgi:hypothetical protein
LSTGHSPFFPNYGYHPWTGITEKQKVTNKTAEQFTSRIKELGEQAKQSLFKAQVQMKKQYYHHQQDTQDYNIGDQVWLEVTNLKTK